MVPLDCAATVDGAVIFDGAVIGDCSAIGEGHAVLHGQGGVFRYGQRFARWNLYILLNGWISIDCASISLEDNAAPTVPLAFVTDTACNNQGMTVRSGCKAAARTILSAADSGCIFSVACGDIAAVDGDLAARTHPSAADSGRTTSAGCLHCAAVDGDLAARTNISAADSGCRSSADCLHCAAVDGDSAVRTGISAADSGCESPAGCLHCAAVDDNIAAATTILTVANSGCRMSAGCGDTAAANGDVATRTLASAADSGCRSSAGCGQRTHVFAVGLGINGKTVALCHIDAVVGGQACVICQNQMNFAADGDAAADGHSVVDYIPAAIPCGHAAFHHSDIICCLFIAVFVQIGNAVRRRQ